MSGLVDIKPIDSRREAYPKPLYVEHTSALQGGITVDKTQKLSRRDFLRLSAVTAASTVIAACGGPAPQQPAAPTAAPAAAAPTAAAAQPTTSNVISAPPEAT